MYKVEKGSVFSSIYAETIDEAKKKADEAVEYTAKDIRVTDVRGNVVSERKWHLIPRGTSAPAIPGVIVLCDGYYAPWTR